MDSLDWQPIETAPRDGTWVLICGRSVFNRPYERNDVHKAKYEWRGWLVSHGSTTNWASDHWPTHWMPLPEAPA